MTIETSHFRYRYLSILREFFSFFIFYFLYKCKVVGLVCNVGLFPTALGPSFLNKGVGTGLTETHLSPACAQTTPRLPSFGYMPMASRAVINKL